MIRNYMMMLLFCLGALARFFCMRYQEWFWMLILNRSASYNLTITAIFAELNNKLNGFFDRNRSKKFLL